MRILRTPTVGLLCSSLLSLAPTATATCATYDYERLSFLQRRDSSVNPDTPAQVSAPLNVSIGIVWHQINNGTHGRYPDKTVEDSIALLNEACAPVDIRFHLANFSALEDPFWFINCGYNKKGSPSQQMKLATHVGTNQTLNVWTTDFPSSFTGFGTLAYELNPTKRNTQLLDGVVLDWKRLPGIHVPRLPGNGPKILVHEVGHWLGLDHVFYGGCEGPGDRVDDTPPSGHPPGFKRISCDLEETCPGHGPDVTWHNPMSYNVDHCLTTFTPGQIKRMWFFLSEYRRFPTRKEEPPSKPSTPCPPQQPPPSIKVGPIGISASIDVGLGVEVDGSSLAVSISIGK